MNMTGNTILVTGGTSGIGRALAEAFHDRGNRVVIAGRRQDKLDEVVAGRPGMQAVQLDQNDPASLSRLAEAARTRFPELNVLVANAGISRAEDMTADGWDTAGAEAVVNTNILGPLRVTAAILPMLKRRNDATVVVPIPTSLSSLVRTFRRIAPARHFSIPGYNRCAISCARFRSRFWSCRRPMWRRS